MLQMTGVSSNQSKIKYQQVPVTDFPDGWRWYAKPEGTSSDRTLLQRLFQVGRVVA